MQIFTSVNQSVDANVTGTDVQPQTNSTAQGDATGNIQQFAAEPSVNGEMSQATDTSVVVQENDIPVGDKATALQGTASQTSEEELLKLISKENLRTPEGVEQLHKSLFALLKEQMLMKPENMDSKEYVREFYERLDEQMGKLQELIKTAGKEDSTLGREVSNVKNNIQFMNQINELYHYVQLPIKMNDEHANGDLYVYKRKNAKTGEDGKLTALLHLSMPTLGNMDIFLSLEEGRLSTRFCLEKEEMIDFIEANIDRLNERLIKKGYQVQTSVTAGMKEEKTVIEHIMESELPIPIMTSQSFDARC